MDCRVKPGNDAEEDNGVEHQKQTVFEGLADRAVQARDRRLSARHRAQARSRSVVRGRAPRPDGRQGPPAGTAAQAEQGRSRDRARPCRLHRAAHCLPRSGHASPSAAGRPAGPRGVRGGRAGAGRGDRRAAHGRRRQEYHRHAGREISPRQIRGHHRARRRADRGRAGAHGARTADRPGAAGGGQEAGRSLASADRGPRRARSRPAGIGGRGPEAIWRRGARSARRARNGRRPQPRQRGGRRGRRGGPPQAGCRRGRRGRR